MPKANNVRVRAANNPTASVAPQVYTVRSSKQRKPRALMKFAAGWSPSGYTLDVPVITQTESNANEHWRTRHGRAKAQRALTMMALNMLPYAEARTRITWVSFQRFAPGELDCDNLPGSCKHVRDQVVAWIAGENTVTGEGDDSPRCGIRFDYAQQKSKLYGVRLEMTFEEARES